MVMGIFTLGFLHSFVSLSLNTIVKLEMKEKKHNHLTLEVKQFMVQEKGSKPRKGIKDLIFDENIKYGSHIMGSKLRRERFIGFSEHKNNLREYKKCNETWTKAKTVEIKYVTFQNFGAFLIGTGTIFRKIAKRSL